MSTSAELSVVSVNIEDTKHLPDVERYILLTNPSVLGIQECPESLLRVLMTMGYSGHYEGVVERTIKSPEGLGPGMTGTYLGWNGGLTAVEKHTILFGNARGKRVPLDTKTDADGYRYNAVGATLEMRNGIAITLFSAYCTWTANGAFTPLQMKHLTKLDRKLNKYPRHVVFGDFNAPRGREGWEILKRGRTDGIPEDVKTTLNRQVHRAGNNLPDLVVDGTFVRGEGVEIVKVGLEDAGSDHFAIRATIRVRK